MFTNHFFRHPDEKKKKKTSYHYILSIFQHINYDYNKFVTNICRHLFTSPFQTAFHTNFETTVLENIPYLARHIVYI